MDMDDDHPLLKPHKVNPYNLNSKIMLAAIISLSVVVTIVTVLHIYARFIICRQARRRAAHRHLSLAISVAHNTAETEPPKAGLDQAVITSLPIFTFKRTGDPNDETPETECAVCLSMLEDEQMARILPNCKHTFHAECIDRWLSLHSTCPICRTEAEPRAMLVPEPREPPAARIPPTAPSLDEVNSTLMVTLPEGNSHGVAQQEQSSAKVSSSSSRLSSFRRILSRERSFQRVQSCGQDDGTPDLERQ